MVEADGRLQKAFPAPPMVCLKRGKNLGDKMIRARLPKVVRRDGTRSAKGPGKGFMCGKTGRKECSLCPFTGPAAARSPGKAGDHWALRAASGHITTNGMQALVLPLHTDWNQAMLWTAVPWTELQAAVPEVCRSPGGHPGIILIQ